MIQACTCNVRCYNHLCLSQAQREVEELMEKVRQLNTENLVAMFERDKVLGESRL
jgi:hypothetical protein